MTTRRETRVYSKTGSEMYLVRKSYDGTEVHVVRFDRDYQASDFIASVVGHANGFVYAMTGRVVECYGARRSSVKQVVAEVNHWVDKNGYYR